MGQNGEIEPQFGIRLLGPPQKFTLDEGGRLTIPSKMRPFFPEKVLVVSVAKDTQSLILFPLPTWEAVLQRYRTLAQRRVQANKLRLRVGKDSAECSIDASWRVLLPEQMRRKAGIEREVIVVGALDRVTLWNPQTWLDTEREIDEDPDLDALEEEYNF